jgi:WD40 repeat protein
METGERRELGPGTAPVYSREGYLIHSPTDMSGRGLWALPFSLDTLEATGDAFPISTTGFAPSVSHDGTLVYRDDAGGFENTTLVWRSRKGEIIETVGQPQPDIADLALSPDGQRVAVVSMESGIDVWVHDLTRSTKTRLTFEDKFVGGPAWSPSGREIGYYLRDGGRIMRRAADGSCEAVTLVE